MWDGVPLRHDRLNRHVAHLARLDLDPPTLAQRVASLVSRCQHDTVQTTRYADLIGP